MVTRKNTFKRIELRKQSAANRQAERNLRTPAQQIERLDQMFGAGVGAKKERVRLLALMRAV